MTQAITLSTLGPHSPEYTAEVANGLAECARVLNYATGSGADAALRHPADAYELLGSLYTATGRLPQLTRQVGDWLERRAGAGALAVDGDARPGAVAAAVASARAHLSRAASAADMLTGALREAQSAIAWVGSAPGTTGEG